MAKEAIIAFGVLLAAGCAAKAELDVKVLFDISTLTVPERGDHRRVGGVRKRRDGRGVVTIVPGDCPLLKSEIAEHAPNASFDYDAKLWSFTDEEFTALHVAIQEFGMRVVFVPADNEDDEAGSGEEREEDPGGFLQQRRMRIPMAASSRRSFGE